LDDADTGVKMMPLPEDYSGRLPLSKEETSNICKLAFQAEVLFKTPQDE
jgi:hypothetical protein